MWLEELGKVCQNWFYARKFVKKPFYQTFASFTHFDKFVGKQNLRWKANSLEFTHNPHTSHKFAQTLALTLSLDLQSSIAQMNLEG